MRHPAVGGAADEYHDDPDDWEAERNPDQPPTQWRAVGKHNPVDYGIDRQHNVQDRVRPGQDDATLEPDKQGVMTIPTITM